MARAIWSGALNFGLVSVPVKLYPAVKDRSVRFHLLSPDGRCRLRRRLVCPETGEEYQQKETVRGYEIAPERYVIVTEQEIESLKPEAEHAIEISDFVGLDEIDPIYFNRTYYLAPVPEKPESGYDLLLRALLETNKVGLAKFVMHGKEYLAAVRAIEGCLCLETMNFADEVSAVEEVPGLPARGEVHRAELDVAKRLIEVLAKSFRPEKYHDEHRQRIMELVGRKAAGEEIAIRHEVEEEEVTRAGTLMEALEASLRRVRRAATPRPPTRAPKRRPRGAE